MRTVLPPILVIQNTTVVASNGRRILHDVDLTLSQGEHTAIIGPNGSGKSSLMRLVSQQYRPFAHGDPIGTVQIFGRERWNIFELRTLLGMLDPELDRAFSGPGRGITGLEAVASGFFASLGLFPIETVTEPMWAQSRATLEQVDAALLADRYLDEMSTGEVRRILIARALVHQPKALLLDEPTTGLDLAARVSFVHTLRTIAAGGKTIILITHHLEEVFPEIERVVLIQRGRIVADGPKRSILTNDRMTQLFNLPISVHWTRDGYCQARLK